MPLKCNYSTASVQCSPHITEFFILIPWQGPCMWIFNEICSYLQKIRPWIFVS